MFFVFILCFIQISFAAVTENNIYCVSYDILAEIISRPDIQACNEIIKEHFQLYGENQKNNTNNQINYIAVKKALFPCYNLTLTCKSFNSPEFKKQILFVSTIHLQKIFQPGIPFFLIPLALQKKIEATHNEESRTKIKNLLYETIDEKQKLTKEAIETDLLAELQDTNILYSQNYSLHWPNELWAYFTKETIFEYLLMVIISSIGSRKRTGRLDDNVPTNHIIKHLFPHVLYFLHQAIEKDPSFLLLPACELRETTVTETKKHYERFGFFNQTLHTKIYYHQQTIGYWLKTNTCIQACLAEADDNPKYFKIIQRSLEDFNEDTEIKMSKEYLNNPQENQILTNVIDFYLGCHPIITNDDLIVKAQQEIKKRTQRKEKFQYRTLFLIKYVFFPIMIFILRKKIAYYFVRLFKKIQL